MAPESPSDDLNAWPPSEAYDHAKWNLAWTRIFQQTQGALAMEFPEYANALQHTHEGHLILQFGKRPDSDLAIEQGIWIPRDDGGPLPLHLSDAASAEILNGLDPELRIAMAREMTWTRVAEVLEGDDEDEEEPSEQSEFEGGWEDSDGEDLHDFSSSIPELEGWKVSKEYDEDFPQEEEREREEEGAHDPNALEAANQDPSLRALYLSFVKGKIQPSE